MTSSAGLGTRLDATCFRLSRLAGLMDEADVTDYRRWSRSQVAQAELELKCTVGRDQFREGARRHGEWLHSLTYDEYLATGDWAVVRYFALRRAGYQCEECSAGRDLHVHHRTYERRCEERLSDLVALCPECHARLHGELPAPPSRSRGGLRPFDPFAALGAHPDFAGPIEQGNTKEGEQ